MNNPYSKFSTSKKVQLATQAPLKTKRMEEEKALKGRSSKEAGQLHNLKDLRDVSCYLGPGTRHLNSVLQ